jgi:hypothetical protein
MKPRRFIQVLTAFVKVARSDPGGARRAEFSTYSSPALPYFVISRQPITALNFVVLFGSADLPVLNQPFHGCDKRLFTGLG